MIGSKSIIGLIPARASSKGLPGKNTKEFLGKPLISWSIEAAQKSKYIDKVVVNTDSNEIAEISRKFGAEVPYMRPKELSLDNSLIKEVITDFQHKLEKIDAFYGAIVLLQPTSPLRRSEDIDQALELFVKKDADSVISVSENNHFWWTGTLPEDKSLNLFAKNIQLKQRQELEVAYCLNGSIYILDWDFIKKSDSFFGQKSFAYVTPREFSVDIDDEVDFAYAEFLAQNRN